MAQQMRQLPTEKLDRLASFSQANVVSSGVATVVNAQ